MTPMVVPLAQKSRFSAAGYLAIVGMMGLASACADGQAPAPPDVWLSDADSEAEQAADVASWGSTTEAVVPSEVGADPPASEDTAPSPPSDCDDGDPCTIDLLQGFHCVFYPIPCGETENPCTALSCHGGECVEGSIQGPCDDGEACTQADACKGGDCVGLPLTCDDGDPCSIDACVAGACVASPILCDDGDPCTVNACTAGACVTSPIVCDDGDPCTDDTCADGACVASPTSCDDGDLCTDDSCSAGACVATPVSCNDGDACTVDGCVASVGCFSVAISCEDGSPCTDNVCTETGCVTTWLSCDDGDPCTTNACKLTGCVATPIACDDDDPCTTDSCVEGACEHVPIVGAGCWPESCEFPCDAPMVAIAGGKYIRGSPQGEGGPDGTEWPMTLVEVAPFEIDQFEVTNVAFAAFLKAHGNVCSHPLVPSFTAPCYDCDAAAGRIACDANFEISSSCQTVPYGASTGSCAGHPVVATWFGAHAYCQSLGKRLPTATEWERAANGPGGADGRWWRRFPWSEGCQVNGPPETFQATDCPPLDECPIELNNAWYLGGCTGAAWSSSTALANCGNGFLPGSAGADCFDGYKYSAPVGTFPGGVSVEGVHDLSGNAPEWVDDLWSYSPLEPLDPTITKPAWHREFRSAGWGGDGATLRSAERLFYNPTIGWHTGFRCAQ